MLMKIDQTMESGGSSGEDVTSPPSRGSLSPMALPLSSRGSKAPYSPPMDRNSPLGPPTSLAAQHMINSIAASSAKNMTPGILASLSALNAMSSAAAAASFHHDFGGSNSSFVGDRGLDRHPYGSPPAPVVPTNDPSANECKLVDYRGQKVAAFVINGDTMLCLPQAFELFLKHLVGGLHTVYTKLKRLDIVPIVCNVEQVRILRGLGAIQPGVNRCKLLSCKDFDVLYKDCTTASSRPGRPPKRTSVPLVPLSQHGTPSQFMSMKKHRLENGEYPPYEASHHNPADVMRLEKSPLLANGYNHPPTQIPPMHLLPLAGQSAAAAAAVAAHAALFSPSGLPLPPGHPRDCRSAPIQSLDAVAARNATWETCRTAYEDFVKQFESRYHEDCSDSEKSSHANEAGSGEGFIRNGNLDGSSPVLNLSKNTTDTVSDSDENGGDDEEDYSDNERNDGKYPSGLFEMGLIGGEGGRSKVAQVEDRKSPSEGSVPQTQHETHASHFAEVSAAEAAISSTENLLRNIQGLLKVAADNAKQQERRVNLEKAEFKMEIMRERELREQLEKQLVEERNLRTYYEKRWKKERRFRKKLEDNQDDSSQLQQQQQQQQQQLPHRDRERDRERERDRDRDRERDRERDRAERDREHPHSHQIQHSHQLQHSQNQQNLHQQHHHHQQQQQQQQPPQQIVNAAAEKCFPENAKSQQSTPSTNGSVKGDSSDR